MENMVMNQSSMIYLHGLTVTPKNDFFINQKQLSKLNCLHFNDNYIFKLQFF